MALSLVVLLTTAFAPMEAHAAGKKSRTTPIGGVVSEITIEGNVSVNDDKIRGKLLTKTGSPLDDRLLISDVKSLMDTRWFSEVRPYYMQDKRDPSGKSYIVYYNVKEMPILTKVEFRGRKAIKLRNIEESTGLRVGNRADATRTHLAVGQIKRLYEEKGYEFAEVELVKGGNPGDTDVVIAIYEGPKRYLSGVDFKGNVYASDAMLHTKISSRERLFGLIFGKYQRDVLEEDVRKLKDYYWGQGFLEVKITPVTRTRPDDLGGVLVEFDISEGVRYRVRNISFEGNQRIKTENLRAGLLLHSGQPMLETAKENDRKSLVSKYNQLGCIDTQILPDGRYTDEPGVIDIVYRIQEGEPFLVGNIDIRGNDRTRDKVVRRELNMAGLLPGEPLDGNRLELGRQRLVNLQYFTTTPDAGSKPLELKLGQRHPHDKPYGETATTFDPLAGVSRMQGPEIEPAQPTVAVPRVAQGFGGGGRPPVNLGAPTSAPAASSPLGGASNVFDPPVDIPPIEVPVPPNAPSAGVPVPPSGRGGTNAPPIGAGEPPGTIPSQPGLNVTDVGPDRQDPFASSGFADIVANVQEAPTGRFMLGVGASSWQGLTGNLTIFEKNFDMFNVPRSWNDLIGGNAFRGGGQQLRIELMPGQLINRFQVSLTEPYLFDLPIGASGSGYLFNRIYPDWTESRAGGRFSLGKQFGTQTYADVAFRVEEVDFYGYRSPAPADYIAASGHSTLATLRPSLRFDNRNSPFMTNKGQYLEFSFEQGWGTFTYPKAEIEGRTYFTLGTRADGSGKRILTFRDHLGATGRDTPVYERFFAGNFGSLRGFQYRGVGPHELNHNIGGVFEFVGSVEYQFPLSANDMFHQVIFCDYGTVNNNYNFNDFRVSVGTGLRMLIPAMGPMPLCFDLAFPIAKSPGDRVQDFNFTIGAFY